MKKMVILTGPQGSGNHIFSRIFSFHPDVSGWNAILHNYWVPTDEDPFAYYFKYPGELYSQLFNQSDYFVTDVSCPFVYDGKREIPNILQFVEKIKSFGVEPIICVIVRDENITKLQQKRLRGEETLPIALNLYEELDDVNFLSLESLFLYKEKYLKWLAKVLDFPIDYWNEDIFKYLDEHPNKKYVKYVEEYWLDDEVKKGLQPFSKRVVKL